MAYEGVTPESAAVVRDLGSGTAVGKCTNDLPEGLPVLLATGGDNPLLTRQSYNDLVAVTSPFQVVLPDSARNRGARTWRDLDLPEILCHWVRLVVVLSGSYGEMCRA